MDYSSFQSLCHNIKWELVAASNTCNSGDSEGDLNVWVYREENSGFLLKISGSYSYGYEEFCLLAYEDV
jgi:hypothetical protein